MCDPITVLTPVFIDRPERLEYLETTLRSFAGCNLYSGSIIHHLADDRSPLGQVKLHQLCAEFGIRKIRRVEADERRGFFDVFRTLVASVQTEFYLYLEPDHYFYLPADFFSPIMQLFRMLPELVCVYLRAPMTRNPFKRVGDELITFDRTVLSRIPIDGGNTGWVGRGRQHEGFSLMPTVFRTKPMHDYFLRDGLWIDVRNPYELEMAVDHDWNCTRLTGYLNAQAFCYHIGAVGGMGGGHTVVGDRSYENAWSEKVL